MSATGGSLIVAKALSDKILFLLDFNAIMKWKCEADIYTGRLAKNFQGYVRCVLPE